jgi:tetratricopeptide (TPR) repeat protein
LCNAALCLDYLDRPAEALPEHQAALEMRQRIYHADHPDVVVSLANLGLCLEHLGRFDEALSNHDEALAMAQRVYMGDNMEVARRLRDRALCLERMGRWPEALTNEEASLAMCQKIDAGDHPNLAIVLISIGDSLSVLSRFDEAIPKYEQALAMFKRIDAAQPGNNVVRSGLARSCLKLGDLLGDKGRTAEAITNYQSGLRIAASILESDAANADAKKLRVAFRIKLGEEKAEVVVNKILPRSQAEQIDLREGDVLVHYNGHPVVSSADLPILTGRATGSGIALEIRRDGAPLDLAVKVGPLGALCEDRTLPASPGP